MTGHALALALTLLGSWPVAQDVLAPPVWLPDGRLAVLASDGQETLWQIGHPGQPAVAWRPFPPMADPERCWWSPDGGRAAYLARVDNRLTLYLGGPKSDPATAFSVVGELAQPVVAWSPDGRRLAFSRATEPDSTYPYEIFVLGADGSGPMARVAQPQPALDIAWDPSGERFAYVQSVGRTNALFVTWLGERRAVLCSPTLDVLPGSLAWAPNGKRISFSGSGDLSLGARLFLARPDGARPAEALRTSGYLPARPAAWSPDGQWLAWGAGLRSRPEPGQLYIGRTASLAAARPQPGALRWSAHPRFSPDSRWLATASCPPGGSCIMLVLAADTWQIALRLELGSALLPPVFSPDSSRIAVVAEQGGRRGVVVSELPGRE